MHFVMRLFLGFFHCEIQDFIGKLSQREKLSIWKKCTFLSYASWKSVWRTTLRGSRIYSLQSTTRREGRKMIQRQMDVHNPTLLPDTQWAKNPRFNPPKMSKIVPFLSKPPSKDFRFKSLQLWNPFRFAILRIWIPSEIPSQIPSEISSEIPSEIP